jgi:nodulation protein F
VASNTLCRYVKVSARFVEISLVAAWRFSFYRSSTFYIPWLATLSRVGGRCPGGNRRITTAKWGNVLQENNVMTDKLAREIIEKIKAHADPERGEITTATELTELGIHSLELTEIVFDLEEAYGIEIEMNTVEAWNNLKNVGDIVTAVRALIEKQS